MKLDYSIDFYSKKKEEEESEKNEKPRVDFQLYNDFQNGFRQDLEKKKQDIQIAQGQIPQGGSTVS